MVLADWAVRSWHEPGAGEGGGPPGEGGLAGTLMPGWWQGAVRTGRSHWRARSYQDRLAWARVR